MENVLELALWGRAVDPFYILGWMGEQSVAILREKSKVMMLIENAEAGAAGGM